MLAYNLLSSSIYVVRAVHDMILYLTFTLKQHDMVDRNRLTTWPIESSSTGLTILLVKVVIVVVVVVTRGGGGREGGGGRGGERQEGEYVVVQGGSRGGLGMGLRAAGIRGGRGMQRKGCGKPVPVVAGVGRGGGTPVRAGVSLLQAWSHPET